MSVAKQANPANNDPKVRWFTDRIEYDTQYVLEGLVNSVTINWVWLPPWGPERITEDGRDQMRALGFNI